MKSKYIKPSLEVWELHKRLSVLAEGSFTDFGVDEYEQAEGEGYWESIDMS